MPGDSLGDRMKANYEDRYRIKLTRRMPVIIRLDGQAFHTLTRNCVKPFDTELIDLMSATARFVTKKIQGAVFSYTQSDEISILIQDYAALDTSAWFDYNVQKMTSIAASMASAFFCHHSKWGFGYFDCRVFNVPREEVLNYFIWRQQDWTRNSLQMLAQYYFSHKQLHGKNQAAMHEMLYTQHGINWAELEPRLKNGTAYRQEPGSSRCLENYERFQDHREMYEAFVNLDQVKD